MHSNIASNKHSSKKKVFFDYMEYADRIGKTLYYGNAKTLDRPSLPLTELLVERFRKLCRQDRLDKLELYRASSVCYDACATPSSLLMAFLYSNRLLKNNPDYLEKNSSSQVFLIAMMVASKYLYDYGEDDEVYNDEWASSAAMLVGDLNQAELEFLFAIDWNLNIETNEFLTLLNNIEGEIGKRQGLTRGFFTYTDLFTICNSATLEWLNMICMVSKMMLVFAMGYTAALSSLALGAIFSQTYTKAIITSLMETTSTTTSTRLTSLITPDSPLIEQDFHQNHVDDIEDIILSVDRSESKYRPNGSHCSFENVNKIDLHNQGFANTMLNPLIYDVDHNYCNNQFKIHYITFPIINMEYKYFYKNWTVRLPIEQFQVSK